MPDNLAEFIAPMFGVFLSVSLAFIFNAFLQWRLLKEKNKDSIIDMLLQSIKNQSEFYTMLNIAGEKYKIKNMSALKTAYKEFVAVVSGGDFRKKDRVADIKKSMAIHAAANDIRAELWANKI